MKNYSISAKKQKELFNKYPALFEYTFLPSGRSEDPPITSYHIECWKGWLGLIEKLSEELSAIDTEKVIRVEQIKQKLAGLRYYITLQGKNPSYKNKITELVSKYESSSLTVCEACSNPGGRAVDKGTGYLLTLCDKCLETEDFKGCKRLKNTKPIVLVKIQK